MKEYLLDYKMFAKKLKMFMIVTIGIIFKISLFFGKDKQMDERGLKNGNDTE